MKKVRKCQAGDVNVQAQQQVNDPFQHATSVFWKEFVNERFQEKEDKNDGSY